MTVVLKTLRMDGVKIMLVRSRFRDAMHLTTLHLVSAGKILCALLKVKRKWTGE